MKAGAWRESIAGASGAGHVTRFVLAALGGASIGQDGPNGRHGLPNREALQVWRTPSEVLTLVLWARATSRGSRSLRSAGRQLDKMDLMDLMDFRTAKRCTCGGRVSGEAESRDVIATDALLTAIDFGQ